MRLNTKTKKIVLLKHNNRIFLSQEAKKLKTKYIAKKNLKFFFIQFQANVVCRQLGYPNGASSASCCSLYGQVSTSFSYDEVRCTGTESTLNSCPHNNAHDCGALEGAGVVCNTGTGPVICNNQIFLFL